MTELIERSQSLQVAGRFDEAIPPGEEAVAICAELAGDIPNEYWHHPYLVSALWNLAYAYQRAGHHDEAVATMARRVDTYRRLDTSPDLASALIDLSQFLQVAGRYDQAVPPGEEAVDICTRLAGDTPNQYWRHPYLVYALWNLAYAYQRAGHHDEAVATMARRVDTYRRLDTSPDLASALIDLSQFLQVAGRYDQAVPPGEEAVAVTEGLVADALPPALYNLGYAYQRANRPLEALAVIGRRVNALERIGTQENHSAWIAAHDVGLTFWRNAGMPPGPTPDALSDGPRQTVSGPVTALSRNPNQMDVFAVRPDGGVWSAWWNGDPWRNWFRIGSAVFGPATPIAALSRNSDQMDLFAVGLDGGVWSAWWNGNPWRDWFRIGTRNFPQNTPISVLSRNSDQMDLFAVGDDGGLWSTWWNGSWHEWFRIGDRTFPHNTPIAALSRNSDQMDLFAIGDDGGLWSTWWNGSWHEWFRIGDRTFPHNTPIAALSRNSDQMDLFAIGDDGGLWSTWWNGNPWRPWFRIGAATFAHRTPVAALSRNSDQMDVFATGLDGRVWSAWWNGDPWRAWFQLGDGEFAQQTVISALARTSDHMDLFAVGRDGRVRTALWNGNPWLGWFPLSTVQPRPFYVIAHNPNRVRKAREALAAGANALGPDINTYPGSPLLCVEHGSGGADSPTLAQYLDGLHQLALEFPHFALVVFDIKEPAASPDHGLEILTEIRQRLTYDTDVNIILSVAELEHTGAFDRIQAMLGPREGLMVDYENDPGQILAMFNARGVTNQGYGNGITFANRLIGPYYRYTLEAACAFRAQIGQPRFIFSWTNNTENSMREYIDIGVDGIITDDIDDLRSVMAEPGASALVRMATRADNPMQPANNAYGLTIHTTKRWRAGTDANVTFTLIGTQGMAAKTVDTELVNRMESGDWNHVTIPSEDLGTLRSITVRRDDSGNAPDWHLDRIDVASDRFQVHRRAVFDRWIDSTDPYDMPL